MDVGQFRKLPLVGILRGIEKEMVEPLVETAVSSGLKTIEITMNTPKAPELIKLMRNLSAGRLFVGAGTVLSMSDLHSALEAGASFIVMPTLVAEVVEYCAENLIPVFPGALTPQEIFNAWNAGATMVKVFPAKFFGAEYFKELKGPFQNIELLACGGVTPENIASFFDAGVSAIAFGGSVFAPKLLAAQDFSQIGKNIKAFVDQYTLTC
ncbi:bifunctional 4-hydroxy-2-oxoglutarate aldolase/2-dehydro-3-deoxy-phosphogluconate aldolase [Deltaproteobacteria bacterium TL4]